MTQYFEDEHEIRSRIDTKLWLRIARHARPHRWSLAGLAGSGMLLAGIDALFPLVNGRLIDEATSLADPARLLALGGVYLALITGFSLCVWLFIVLAGKVATGVAHDLRRDGFARLQELSFAWFDVRPVGWLVTRLTSDCSKLSSLMPWFMLDLGWGLSLIAAISVAMLLINWPLGLVVLSILPPLAIASWFFQRRLLTSSRDVRRINSQITATYNEAIAGVRTTKTLVREERNLDEFQVQTTEMFGHSMRNALQSAVYLPLVIALGSLGVGLALWRGGVQISAASGFTLGSLVAFMQYAALFYMPIQELARRFTELQAAQAAAERIQELLDTEPQISDAPEVRAAIERQRLRLIGDDVAEDGGEPRIDTIEFRNVGFEYKEGEPVLQAFDLTVVAGQTIALVGPTGGGKSTIVNLAARFYEPTSGEVLINGVEYRQRGLHWLQSNLGVVQQAPHLFSGTIAENIRYGRLDATDDRIEEAARLVNAHGFISEFEEGYGAEVGEGGSRLSTGQRQLVSLARAVLADPQIFVMDEATSSVDTETERLIQGAIDAVLAGRIAFVIAHRLSTIRRADVILVIDGGRIVERGDHDELMRARGRYHALYTKQFAREREAEMLG